jgi:DNA-binding transcriptional MerR regulator
MSASAPAYRTISDVATLIGVPHHVLRFWETKFPVIAPLKRGGGRRYYRPEDVAAIERIARLLHVEGYTIKGVQKLLDLPSPAAAKVAAPAGANAGETTPLARIAIIRADLVNALSAARAL